MLAFTPHFLDGPRSGFGVERGRGGSRELSEFWELAYGMGESRTPRSGRPRHGMVHESSTLVTGRCSDCFECCNTTQKATAPRFRVGQLSEGVFFCFLVINSMPSPETCQHPDKNTQWTRPLVRFPNSPAIPWLHLSPIACLVLQLQGMSVLVHGLHQILCSWGLPDSIFRHTARMAGNAHCVRIPCGDGKIPVCQNSTLAWEVLLFSIKGVRKQKYEWDYDIFGWSITYARTYLHIFKLMLSLSINIWLIISLHLDYFDIVRRRLGSA